MKTDPVTLPAHWASALINDDDSNFDMNDETAQRERELLADTLASLFGVNRFTFVDVGEPYFTDRYDFYVTGDIHPVTGGDVADYVVLYG